MSRTPSTERCGATRWHPSCAGAMRVASIGHRHAPSRVRRASCQESDSVPWSAPGNPVGASSRAGGPMRVAPRWAAGTRLPGARAGWPTRLSTQCRRWLAWIAWPPRRAWRTERSGWRPSRGRRLADGRVRARRRRSWARRHGRTLGIRTSGRSRSCAPGAVPGIGCRGSRPPGAGHAGARAAGPRRA